MNKLDEDIALDCNNRKIRPTIYKTFLKVKSLENGKVNQDSEKLKKVTYIFI